MPALPHDIHYLSDGAFAAVLGLIVGSFLNVVVYRLPRELPFLRLNARSQCPHCGHPLGFFDLIPVVSYLVRGGRCHYCRRPISWRYPVVELAAAFCFGYLAARFGFPRVWPHLLLAATLWVILLIDIDTHYIYTVTLLVLAPAVAAVLWVDGVSGMGWLEALLGGLAAGGLIWAFMLLGNFIFRTDSIGGGDILLMFLLGGLLGLRTRLFLGLLAAVLLGFVVAVCILTAYDLPQALRRQRFVRWRRRLPSWLWGGGQGVWLKLMTVDYLLQRRLRRREVRRRLSHYIAFAPYLIAGCTVAYYWDMELKAMYQTLIRAVSP